MLGDVRRLNESQFRSNRTLCAVHEVTHSADPGGRLTRPPWHPLPEKFGLTCRCGRVIAEVGVPAPLQDFALLHITGVERLDKFGSPNRLRVPLARDSSFAAVCRSLTCLADRLPTRVRQRDNSLVFVCPTPKCGQEIERRVDRLATKVLTAAILIRGAKRWRVSLT